MEMEEVIPTCASPSSQNSPQRPRLSQSEPNSGTKRGKWMSSPRPVLRSRFVRPPRRHFRPGGHGLGILWNYRDGAAQTAAVLGCRFCLQRPLFPVRSAARRWPPSARLLPPFRSSISGTGMQLALAPPQLLPFVSVILCFDSPRSERPSSIPPRPASLFDGLRAPTL